MARRVAFATLGCKVNQYDSEAMLRLFLKAGYEAVDFSEPADVYVINTCTVTGRGAAKSRQLIRQAIRRSPLSVVAVAGCYTQTDPDAIEAIPGVSLLIGNQDRDRVVELVEEAAKGEAPIRAVGNIWRAKEFEELEIEQFGGHTRAVMKIQEGCNIMCTYCIIPYARGGPRSRSFEAILSEGQRLAAAGYREVVLTGIHLGSYGKDLKGDGKRSLAEVVEALAEQTALDRIRLSSLEPGHISDHLIDLLADHPKVCPHLHLSLQSGSETVLKRMKRAYTAAQYRQTVEKLYQQVPDLALTTDVITGFPGETEAEHQESVAFVKEMGFSRLHVFPFSARQGTPAATFPDQVPKQIKEARSRELIAISDQLSEAYHRRYVGQVLDVLVEEEAATQPGWLEGYTPNYIRVRLPGGDELAGTIIETRLTAADADGCQGEMVGHPVGARRTVPLNVLD